MQSKRRKKAGKIFRLALVITVFVLIIATVVLSAAALIFFRVEKYHVEGVSPYTRDQIIEASGIQTGKSLILSLIHISEPTRRPILSRMPSSA